MKRPDDFEKHYDEMGGPAEGKEPPDLRAEIEASVQRIAASYVFGPIPPLDRLPDGRKITWLNTTTGITYERRGGEWMPLLVSN